MSLKLSAGQSSVTGPRERNEDHAAIVTPNKERLKIKGTLFAVADGVSGNAGGKEAAEMTVRTVMADYYSTPDTWQVHTALDKVITAANRWVLSQAASNRNFAGMATTLSMLAFRGRRYFSAHVGDTRIYLLRDEKLSQLTTDHVWDRPDMRHVLKRAIGLDQHLVVDYSDGEIHVGDKFVIMTDGIWSTVPESTIQRIMTLNSDPQIICNELTKAALDHKTLDNSTVIVTQIEALGEDNISDSLADSKHLSVPDKLKTGDTIDEFEVLSVLYESRASLIYKVRNTINSQMWVLKTLQPLLANDQESSQALLNEEWLAKRVVSKYLPQVLPLESNKRSHLYYVMSWHEGATLQHRLESGHHFTASGVGKIGVDMMRGIGALHRLEIIHRDIKPDNLHLGQDQTLRILDLGVALSSSTTNIASMLNPGTPSYMAPELFEGKEASVSTDIYAAGVTLYYLLTRKYPYGEIEPFQHPRFGEPIPPTRYRPDIPMWLENIVLKAVLHEPEKRFETAEEMLLALEHGELKPILAPVHTPLIGRARLVKWQWIAIFSFILNLLLIYLLIVS